MDANWRLEVAPFQNGQPTGPCLCPLEFGLLVIGLVCKSSHMFGIPGHILWCQQKIRIHIVARSCERSTHLYERCSRNRHLRNAGRHGNAATSTKDFSKDSLFPRKLGHSQTNGAHAILEDESLVLLLFINIEHPAIHGNSPACPNYQGQGNF